MHFQKEDETVTFYKGPTGAHWGHPGIYHELYFCSSSNNESTHWHYLTILLLDLDLRRCLSTVAYRIVALDLGPSPWAPMGAPNCYVEQLLIPDRP